MKKKNAIATLTAATLLSSAIASSAFAEEMSMGDSGMSSGNSGMHSESEVKDAAYWQQQKEYAMKKNAVMREKHVADMIAKGMDVTAVTPELLDPAKTDEKGFWDAMKKIHNTAEIASRMKKVEELKAKGIDVSTITEEVLADGAKFWAVVKGLTEGNMGGQYQNHEKPMMPKPNYGEGYKGIKKPGMEMGEDGMSMDKEDAKPYKPEPKKNRPVKNENSDRKPGMNMGNEGMGNHGGMKKKSLISEKARKSLEEKLNAVPTEKKAELYAKAKAVLTAQIEKAIAAKNTKMAAKLEEVLRIVEDVLGADSLEEADIIDSIFK